MANLEITNNATNGIRLWEPVHQDETLNAAGALTYPAGLVLGRIAASGKLTHYNPVGVDGTEVPVAVLANDVTFAGAGDAPIRAIIAGRLRKEDLTEWAAGTPEALTVAEVDLLRDMGIIALDTQQLTEQDNQ
jgi:hypothetical protein